MSAVISECGKYRYVLRRSLGSIFRWYKPFLFVMLNPSTADASEDDPTIRRCIDFAKREGYTHLNVVNLFALRSTDPKELRYHDDPVGPENDRYIEEEIRQHSYGAVCAAWGAHAFAKERAEWFLSNYAPVFCLGQTQDGMPKHPLYLRKDTPLVELDAHALRSGKHAQQAMGPEEK